MDGLILTVEGVATAIEDIVNSFVLEAFWCLARFDPCATGLISVDMGDHLMGAVLSGITKADIVESLDGPFKTVIDLVAPQAFGPSGPVQTTQRVKVPDQDDRPILALKVDHSNDQAMDLPVARLIEGTGMQRFTKSEVDPYDKDLSTTEVDHDPLYAIVPAALDDGKATGQQNVTAMVKVVISDGPTLTDDIPKLLLTLELAFRQNNYVCTADRLLQHLDHFLVLVDVEGHY
jgi:hypothetical protein